VQATAEVTGIRAGLGVGRLHLRLAAAGPFDVVVDATRRPERRGRLFRRVFWHLRRGGSYVAVRHEAQESRFDGTPPEGSLGALLERASAAVQRPGGARRDLVALGHAIERRRMRGEHMVVRNDTAALAKVTEQQGNRLLRLRGGDDRVLQTVPGTTFASRCELLRSTAERPRHAPEEITAPPLSLREYHGAVCVPGQVLVSGHVLLPDTYRHNQRPRLGNQYTLELGRRFAAVDADVENAPLLQGTYFYLDNEVRGHFGHALTEQLSLLWALGAARQHAPDLRPVMTGRRRRELQPFELELFSAAGFHPDGIVLLDAPTRVERLLAATPAFSMPQYVHPLVARVWSEVGDALAARASQRFDHDRIFVGRRTAKRACRNADEVEDLFTAHGFSIVYPEEHALADQVALFRSAEVIAGYGGSGLFQTALVDEPKTVIQIRAETYSPNNEYLMASVLGHRLVSVIGRTARTEDEERRNVKRFQSSFAVDMEHEGRFLREVLEAL
jgi:capsular polysaccharide biosynthesis protein